MGLSAVTIRDSSGGMNNRGNPATIADNESPSCYNVDLDQQGKVQKRRGSLYLLSAAKASVVTSLVDFLNTDGTHKLVYTWGTKINSVNLDGTSDGDITGTVTLTSGQNTLFDTSYVTISNAPALVMTNGTDPVIYWTGSGNVAVLSTATNMPTAAIACEWFGNYLLLGNVKDRTSGNWYRNYLTWSAVTDPTNWTSSNFIQIGSAADPIVAMVKIQKAIVVLKQNSIWSVVSDDTNATFAASIINPKVG